MYRRQHVQDVGMYPSTFSEDYRLWSKLIRKYSFHNLKEILLKYRMTHQSVSNSVLAEEYRATAKKQIIENLRYFVGEDYTIPDDWLEAYRNNFDPLCKPPRVKDMVSCIRELDVITPYIVEKKNVNRNPDDIMLAANKKKEHLLESFLKKIPTKYKVQLLIQTGNYIRMARFLSYWGFKKLKGLLKI